MRSKTSESIHKSVQFNVCLKTSTGNNPIPMDRLILDKDYLELNASLTGNFIFKSEDIIAINPIDIFLSTFGFSAFRIFHKVNNYPEEISFLTLQKKTEVISAIEKSGLLHKGSDYQSPYLKQIEEKQKSGPYPLKKYVLPIAGLIFLLFLGFDFYRFTTQIEVVYFPGPGLFSALVTFISACLLTLFFKPFRNLVVKKGRTIQDINRHLYLYLFVALFILLMNTYLGGIFFLF